MNTENLHEPPSGTGPLPAAAAPAPLLWNPGAAASWSVLLSPVFGALLHMKNWQAMGEPQKAAASRNWAVASVALLVALLVLSLAVPESKGLDLLSRVSGFVMVVAWYYSIGKSQSAAVLARYGKAYPRRGWAKPLGLAVAAVLGLLLLAVLIGVVVGLSSPSA